VSESDRDFETNVAPYVLGALEASEARAFARHLESCASCRDEVDALRPVVDALALAAPRLEVPKALRRRVMRNARARRQASGGGIALVRVRRAALAGTVAVMVAVVVAVALPGHVRLGSAGPGVRTIVAHLGPAELRLTSGGRADLIVDRLPPAPAGRTYELWLQRGPRSPAPSTLFAVTSRGTADVGLPGGAAGVRRVLVTLEPAGGSLSPTTRPVIAVRVA
jgi:anti-sigma-K factor RskA